MTNMYYLAIGENNRVMAIFQRMTDCAEYCQANNYLHVPQQSCTPPIVGSEYIVANYQSEQWEKHQIGLALAKLLGAKRNRDNNTRFDTPIGNKTPIGLYETVKAVMADNPANPRYIELFPGYNENK